MELLTMENEMRLVQALNDLEKGNHSVRFEWSPTRPATDQPGTANCLTENLQVYSRVGDTQRDVVVFLGGLGLVFPVKMTPDASHKCDVHFKIQGNEVLFELQESGLTHTRRLIFS